MKPDANPVLKHRPAESPSNPIIKENIDLTVQKGTALQVVLDREVRVRKVGQPIHGRLVEPVYAFDSAMQQVKEPGKLHRLQRYAVAQFPVHPQYIDAGTMYFAELEKPLEFGSQPLTPEMAASMNGEIPEGTIVHARLMTPLNSANTQKDAQVEAVLSRPLVNDGKLILPQGSVLKGSVVQVKPAQHWKQNGKLRFVFRDLVLPNGVESKVEAMLQGVQSGRADNLQLDAEGGAEAKTPKTRYLRSGIAVGLAAATHEDEP
jgi:hypothetical protein